MKRTEQRDAILKKVVEFLSKEYDSDVKFTGSGEIMMPAVDENQEEFYFKFKASIPRGKRVVDNEGNGSYIPYHGYDEADEWTDTLKERADKKAASAAKAAAKEKEKERKKKAKEIVQKLNTVGLDRMIHEKDE